MVVASGGYDLPAYEKFTTLKFWAEEALQLDVPDTDSVHYTIADTYLLWFRIEDEHG